MISWQASFVMGLGIGAAVTGMFLRQNTKKWEALANSWKNVAQDLLEACEIVMDAVSKTTVPTCDIPHIAHAIQFIQIALKKAKADK